MKTELTRITLAWRSRSEDAPVAPGAAFSDVENAAMERTGKQVRWNQGRRRTRPRRSRSRSGSGRAYAR